MTARKLVHETMTRRVSRRNVLKGTGGLLVTFSLAACSPFGGDNEDEGDQGAAGATATQTNQEVTGDTVPGSTVTPEAEETDVPSTPVVTPENVNAGPTVEADTTPVSPDENAEEMVDSWIQIAPDGTVTALVGKVELGTGVRTALTQIIAEELGVPFERVTMVMGDTAQTQDQGYTAGSKTIQVAGPVVRSAAATARATLLDMAAQQFNTSADQLTVSDGTISAQGDDSQSVTYGDLVGDQQINAQIDENAPVQNPDDYTIVGTPVPRVDIPGKLTGQPSYVQDMVVENMLHARVVRPWVRTPNGLLSTIDSVDESSISDIEGAQVVRDGNFLAVVAEREWDAIQAATQLDVTWTEPDDDLPAMDELYDAIRDSDSESRDLVNEGDADGTIDDAETQLEATYRFPFQSHGSMGPSGAVADIREDSGVVWSSTQGVYPLRGAIADMLGMDEESIQVIHVEGAGCYGHNGFDDAAADAAVISRAVGRPVRVQWMRQDEFAWEPKGPAMLMDLRGGLGPDGELTGLRFESWTPTHTTRPGGDAGNLFAGLLIEDAAESPEPFFIGGERNAPTNYQLANYHIVINDLASPVLHQSALRTLGAMANVFANESFIDELAAAAGADPVEFRLRYLEDPRAIDVVTRAAEKAGWETRPSPATTDPSGVVNGRGIAFAQYENEFTYVATVVELDVDTESGEVRVRNAYVAHDSGLIINPDGIANQIEGNVIQSVSRSLKEQITFDESQITSVDWQTYPIITFSEVPAVEIELIDRPEEPSLGVGEPTSVPTAAAIGNAIFDATGARVREVPITPERVLAALGGG